MNCADLDRLLQAHVGRRLTSRERDTLARHLLVCAHCRLKVQQLRRFELELARRLPAFAGVDFWSALVAEPATVLPREFGRRLLPLTAPARLPAPLPRRRPAPPTTPAAPQPPKGGRARHMGRLTRRALGLALLAALAVAALHRLLGPELAPADDPLTLPLPADFDRVDFVTPDPAVLRDWFRIQLGDAPPLPPLPAGTVLLGGRVESFGPEARAVAVVEVDGRRAALYALGADDGTGLPPARLGLRYGGWTFVLVGELPPERLAAFAEAAAPTP